jgi:hypothetical protein
MLLGGNVCIIYSDMTACESIKAAPPCPAQLRTRQPFTLEPGSPGF